MEWVISFAFLGVGMRLSVYRDREYLRAKQPWSRGNVTASTR